MPPATVTASLKFSVKVTVLPASRSPLEGDATSDAMVGVVVSICGLPWARPVNDRLAALPAPSCTVPPLRLTADTFRSGVFCPAPTV